MNSSPLRNQAGKRLTAIQALTYSAIWAAYEVCFALLPGLVWTIALLALNKSGDDIYRLLAWSFISVSVYSSMVRDSARVFSHENTLSNRQDRDVSVMFGVGGVVISSVLLAFGVAQSQGAITDLPEIYYIFVFAVLSTGVLALFAAKWIAFWRNDFNLSRRASGIEEPEQVTT